MAELFFSPQFFRVTVVTFLLALAPTVFSFSQSLDQLEQNKKNLEREIHELTNLLQQNRKTAETNTMQLVLLNKQINARQELISTNEIKIIQLARQIAIQSKRIGELNSELDILKESYARMVRHAYLSRNKQQRLAFLLSSSNFNQAIKRLRYLRQYAKHRQVQAQRIEETRLNIEYQVAIYQKQKEEHESLLSEQIVVKTELENEKSEKDKVIKKLGTQERELKRRLQQQESAKRQLEREITRIIEEERMASAQRARDEGQTVAPGAFALTPEQQILSDRFAENRGKLPWPVERGIITGNFGNQPHPTLRNIRVHNDGIEIATVPNASIRAVFDGTVTKIIRLRPFYAVIVNHGEFLSVYTNLAWVSVKEGDRVATRQVIGTVGTSAEDGKTQTVLQLWQGLNKLNPSDWVAPR